MKKIFLAILLVLSLGASAQTVKIAAAGDMKYIMPEFVVKYKELHPKADIQVSYGSSGMFYQQIYNGASFDLFFSADITYPQKLKADGLVLGDVITYAYGSLVLYSATLDVSKGIDVLKESRINKIGIANPQHAPYGKRAEECLKYYKLYDSVKDRLVFGDNILQTAQYALTGNVDVALIALSIAMAPEIKGKGNYLLLDSKSFSPLEQGCVMMKNSQNSSEAAKFKDFILSNESKAIFEKYGFRVP